jgi:dUTP pyrophosphatase
MFQSEFVKTVPLKYHKLYADVADLNFATQQSACADVRAYFGTYERMFKVYNNKNVEMQYMAFQMFTGDTFHTVLNPGDRAMIPTGIVLDIPKGYSVRVHPRSGMSIKQGVSLCNSQGIIDSDYVEQFYITVINFSDTKVRIDHGDRIAQLELVQHPAYSIEMTPDRPERKTERAGGFGSTGKN